MKQSADPRRAERALAEFLDALGYDSQSAEFCATPGNVTHAYLNDLIVGEDVDIPSLIREGSVAGTSKCLVVVSDIAVCTLCPHHLLPAEGHATVAYVPGQRLLGLGAVAALVDALSRRLTLQESITESVVEALMQEAGAEGAYCRIELQHSCLRLRGQRQASAKVVTSQRLGSLLEPARMAELSLLVGAKG